MRILTFLHSFEPGGVERVALRLAGAWADVGHDVRVVVGRNEGPQGAIAPDDVTYDFAPESLLARPFETPWLVWHLIRAIRRERPDVLFCAGSTYVIVAALVRLLLRGDCPPIVAKISNSLERRDLWPPARACLRIWLRLHPHIVDRAVGMAAPMFEEIERCLRISPDRIAIIPDPALNAQDIRILSVHQPRRDAVRRFVAVGRLTAQKNFALLIRAFAAMATPNDRLLILGEGVQRRRLTRLAAKLGLEAKFEMAGHVLSVAEVLARSDVFVSSSNYEGLPSVVVEALAAGLPIVATNCSACMDYLLGYGKLGRLVPIRDETALANAMREAPTPDNQQLMAMHAAAAHFTIERSTGLYLELFAAAAKAAAVPRFADLPAAAEAA